MIIALRWPRHAQEALLSGLVVVVLWWGGEGDAGEEKVSKQQCPPHSNPR
jgi:hypothetical protein